jgi:hypothetical protein
MKHLSIRQEQIIVAIQGGAGMKARVCQHGAVSLLLLLLPFAVVFGQPTTMHPTVTAPQHAAAVSQAPVQVLPTADLATKREVDALRDSVTKMTAAVDKLAAKRLDLVAPIFGMLGVLFGGLINFWATRIISKSKEEADRRIAEDKSKLDVAKSIVDWKLKQLSELYGPLRTLFAQSNAVYRTMNVVLQNADPGKFKLLGPNDLASEEFKRFKPEADDDGKLFVIRRTAGGEWERFRTVLYIDEVYGKSYQVELYFDKTVDISRSIVTVIETKAGLALSDEGGETTTSSSRGGNAKLEDTLRHKFGQYLAHAGVLQSIHANRRAVFRKSMGEVAEDKEPLALNLAIHASAAFPQQIQKLVGTAYDELQAGVDDWAKWAQ